LKRKIVAFLILCCFCFHWVGSFAYSNESKPSSILVYSDPDVELLKIVDFLSSVEEYSNCQFLSSVFLYQAKKYFYSWKDHEAVKLYSDIKKQELTPLVYQIVLQGEPWNEKFDSVCMTDIQKETMVSFFEALHSFSKDTHFSQFMVEMKEPYSQIPDMFLYKNQMQEWIDISETFFGYSFHQVHVLLCPTSLYSVESFLIFAQDSKQMDLYILTSLSGVQNGYLQFGSEETFNALLPTVIPDYSLEYALHCYGMDLNELTIQTDEYFVSQILTALRVSVYGDLYTGVPLPEFFEYCTEKGDLFVPQVYSVVEREYTSPTERKGHFITYCPTLYRSILSLYEGENG